MVKQLSVFIENKPGRLMEVLQALAEKNIDIKALSLADTTEFGIIRMVVSNAEAAKEALNENGVIVRICNVLAVAVNDEPGALMKTFAVLSDNKISVEYMYAFISKTDKEAFVILRVEDNDTAEKIFAENNVKRLTQSDIAEM